MMYRSLVRGWLMLIVTFRSPIVTPSATVIIDTARPSGVIAACVVEVYVFDWTTGAVRVKVFQKVVIWVPAASRTSGPIRRLYVPALVCHGNLTSNTFPVEPGAGVIDSGTAVPAGPNR